MKNSIFEARESQFDRVQTAGLNSPTDEELMRQDLHISNTNVGFQLENELLWIRAESTALPTVDERSMVVQFTRWMLFIIAR